jgi:replicative DNA helicase
MSKEDGFRPHSDDMERALMTCLLIDDLAYSKISSIIKSPDAFYDRRKGYVFSAIKHLFDRGEKIDVMTIAIELEAMKKFDEVGGELALAQMSGEVATSAHIESYAKVVLDRWIARTGIIAAQQFMEKLNTANLREEVEESISNMVERLSKAVGMITGSSLVEVVKYFPEVLDEIKAESKIPPDERGFKTGFPFLDKRKVLRPGRLTMILGGASSGKSDTMMNWALNASKRIPTVLFSLEMVKRELIVRMIAMKTGNNSDLIDDNAVDLDAEFWDKNFLDNKLYVDDSTGATTLDIRAKVATLSAQKKVKLFFIDHMQHLKFHTKHSSDNENWRSITQELKRIAKDYDVSICLLNQLSREGQRAGKDAQMHHSRQAGDEDADIMVYLWRALWQKEADYDNIHCNVRKNRGGRLGRVFIGYDMTNGRQHENEDQKPSSYGIKTENADDESVGQFDDQGNPLPF